MLAPGADNEAEMVTEAKAKSGGLREKSSKNLVYKLQATLEKTIRKERNQGDENKKIYSKDGFRKITKILATEKQKYYTERLKSYKVLRFVIKGIKPEIDPNEAKHAACNNK